MDFNTNVEELSCEEVLLNVLSERYFEATDCSPKDKREANWGDEIRKLPVDLVGRRNQAWDIRPSVGRFAQRPTKQGQLLLQRQLDGMTPY